MMSTKPESWWVLNKSKHSTLVENNNLQELNGLYITLYQNVYILMMQYSNFKYCVFIDYKETIT